MPNSLPIFQYYPTVLWVDDDEMFLHTVKTVFHSQMDRQKTFICAQDCRTFLDNYKSPLSQVDFLHAELNDENYSLLNHAPVNFDVTSVPKLRDLPEKSQEIALVICDHRMPDISGLEFCYQLQKFPLKKILLTGEVQSDEAIRAFNTGIIDKFIRKDSPQLFAEVELHSRFLIRQYFREFTYALLLHLETGNSMALSDPRFVAFFDSLCERNKIHEFYLIDKTGSFLLVDNCDAVRYFVLHDDNTLDQFSKFYADVDGIKSYICEIANRSKVPFFGCGVEAWQIDVSRWGDYFYVPNVFYGKNGKKYYWALI